jgi:hypothetical protein
MGIRTEAETIGIVEDSNFDDERITRTIPGPPRLSTHLISVSAMCLGPGRRIGIGRH